MSVIGPASGRAVATATGERRERSATAHGAPDRGQGMATSARSSPRDLHAVPAMLASRRLQAMADHARQHCLHVLRQHVSASFKIGPGARGVQQIQARARAQSGYELGRLAGVSDQGLQIVVKGGGRKHLAHRPLQREQNLHASCKASAPPSCRADRGLPAAGVRHRGSG